MENAHANVNKVDTMLFKELKLLLVNKDTKAASICIKHHSKARNRDLGLESTR